QVRMDPEAIDVRTDIYSLGVILYELLTGKMPYKVVGPLSAVFQSILETWPPLPSSIRPSIDSSLDAIILKMLGKEREARYQSAAALAEDIGHYQAGEPIQARPPGAALLLRLWLRQNLRAALWTVAIGLVCGLLCSLAVGMPRLMPWANYSASAY